MSNFLALIMHLSLLASHIYLRAPGKGQVELATFAAGHVSELRNLRIGYLPNFIQSLVKSCGRITRSLRNLRRDTDGCVKGQRVDLAGMHCSQRHCVHRSFGVNQNVTGRGLYSVVGIGR